MLLRLKQWQWWQLCMCTTLVQILCPRLCLSIKRPSLCWGCARFGPLRSQQLHNWVFEKRKKKRLVWWARRNILQGQFREGKLRCIFKFSICNLFEHNMGGKILKLIVWEELALASSEFEPDFREDKYTNNWAQFSILIIIRRKRDFGQKQPRPVYGKTKR